MYFVHPNCFSLPLKFLNKAYKFHHITLKNEKLTRKEIIDNRLKEAGWKVGDQSQVMEEFDILVDPNRARESSTKYGGHQFSDYVLLGRDGKPLAAVEAKKSTVDAAIGR